MKKHDGNVLRRAALYLGYRLGSLLRQKALWAESVLGPVALLVLLPLYFGMTQSSAEPAAFRPPPQDPRDVWIVATTPDDAALAEQAFKRSNWRVSVDASPPADVDERLASAALDLVITLAPDFHERGALTFRQAQGADPRDVHTARSNLIWALRNRTLAQRAGPALEVTWPDLPGGEPEATGDTHDGSPQAPTAEDADGTQATSNSLDATEEEAALRHTEEVAAEMFSLVAAMLIATATFGGLFIGYGIPWTAQPSFLHLAGLLVGPRAVYLCELLSATLVQGLRGLVWVTVLVLGGRVFSTRTASADLYASILTDAPVLLFMVGFVGALQAVPVGLIGARVLSSIPPQVRTLLQNSLFVPILLTQFLVVMLPESLLNLAMALPLVGPFAIWLRRDTAPTWIAPSLTLQVVWTLAAIALGAYVHALDESPFRYLRRRWRARRRRSAAPEHTP